MIATYLIEFQNFQEELCTSELLKAHVLHLETLYRQKKLLFCGPCEDGSAFFLFSVASKQEVIDLLSQDPFIIHSVYQLGSVKMIRLATPENQFLLKK
ncbi:hypothetical protein IM40_01360 [Candidatus Paracaedimonas acanthamoebae]|nr:hypothetical protein IM40_01360 [Candidatus Paracaedimonas acanthamoebae]